MLRQIKVTELCKELEEKLVGLQYSEDSLRRYRKVFREFEEYAGDCDYSQSRGTDFLLWKFKQLGGFVTSGEHSKNEMYYFRVIRSQCSLRASSSSWENGFLTVVSTFKPPILRTGLSGTSFSSVKKSQNDDR